jgi:hypothetical protein
VHHADVSSFFQVVGVDSVEYTSGGNEHGILKPKTPEGIEAINKMKVRHEGSTANHVCMH